MQQARQALVWALGLMVPVFMGLPMLCALSGAGPLAKLMGAFLGSRCVRYSVQCAADCTDVLTASDVCAGLHSAWCLFHGLTAHAVRPQRSGAACKADGRIPGQQERYSVQCTAVACRWIIPVRVASKACTAPHGLSHCHSGLYTCILCTFAGQGPSQSSWALAWASCAGLCGRPWVVGITLIHPLSTHSW